MSGNLPSRNREESREKYHEVVLENPGDLTMYTWAQMQALELLPGRVPANESGFHFPGVMRGITMELVQKRPFDYTYNQAMNMVKNYVIPKTVINLNLESDAKKKGQLILVQKKTVFTSCSGMFIFYVKPDQKVGACNI